MLKGKLKMSKIEEIRTSLINNTSFNGGKDGFTKGFDAAMELNLSVLFADWRDDNCFLADSLGIWIIYTNGGTEAMEFSREELFNYWLENIYLNK